MTVRLPKARVTLDIDHELLVWITTYAKEQGKSRNEVVGEAVERFRTAKEGRKMTTAERVAQMLGDDGTKFEAEDGRTLDELAEASEARIAKHETEELWRHLFPDGSAIVAAPGAWDIEGPTPFSWAGAE